MSYLLALAIAVGSWLPLPGGSWQPTTDQVADLRIRLEPHAKAEASSQRENLAPWESYTFQYQGQTQDGKLVIFVNAFCSKPSPTADKELELVFDGGACYFRVNWDPKSQKFTSFQFNGHA
jgi:hypothetical protein